MKLLFELTLQKKSKYFPLSFAGSGQQHADSVAEVNPRNQRRLGSGHGVWSGSLSQGKKIEEVDFTGKNQQLIFYVLRCSIFSEIHEIKQMKRLSKIKFHDIGFGPIL